MSRLTHTEYLLEGRSALDPREGAAPHDVRAHGDRIADGQRLRGHRPPRDDAARVLRGRARAVHAARGRRYDLDAPILIRTAYLDAHGRVRVPVGATLVRHSDPEGEVAETRAKAAGVLAALGALPRTTDECPIAAATRRPTAAERIDTAARRPQRPPRRLLAIAAGPRGPRGGGAS